VRESFIEYKKNLEQNLGRVTYLYNGDVISSTEETYCESKSSPLTSPNFIVNCLIEIYKKSFENLIHKSEEIIIPEEYLVKSGISQNIFDHFLLKNITPTYIFCSEKSKSFFYPIFQTTESSDLPSYFYPIDNITGLNSSVYLNPYIKELEQDGEMVIFISDSGIQSLVYGIQNMDYLIEPEKNENSSSVPETWIHTIKYNFYNCNFKSYKVIIKNMEKIRNQKINKILGGN